MVCDGMRWYAMHCNVLSCVARGRNTYQHWQLSAGGGITEDDELRVQFIGCDSRVLGAGIQNRVNLCAMCGSVGLGKESLGLVNSFNRVDERW